MKTFKLFSMAALALAMAACSSEDSALESAAPAQQQGAMKFTATLAAPGSGATTRTTYTEVTSGDDAGTINVAWNAGDEICITDDTYKSLGTATVGTPAADGSAAISGTITGSDGDNVSAFYPASAITDQEAFFAKYKAQEGTLDYIQNNLDLRMGTGTLSVNGDVATLADNLEMQSVIAIWKLTLQDSSSEALSATKVIVYLAGAPIASTTDISGTSTVYLALPFLGESSSSDVDINIVAIVGSDTYIYSKSGVSLAAGKYYQSTVKMAKFTNLSTISSNYEVQNGEVLTGTLASNVRISIADGATVTLKDVTINGVNNYSYQFAGITCLGDATIILEGANTVKGFDQVYPGIQVPVDKTLTIQGTGTLNASSNHSGAGIGGGYQMSCGNIVIKGGEITATGGMGAGAGIGCSDESTCGNITISGGIVVATGGESAAGIGGGYEASCGNITINGGTVTATGGSDAAGIGGGYDASCGNITITSGVTSVTATKGSSDAESIGAGTYGTCGTVTIEYGANVIQN